jgi:hypothetical protein
MSNPCGHPHCMEWECEYCNHFKPYLFKIRVPRWFGKLLFEFEEYLFFKHWQKTHNDDGKGEF